MRDDDKAETPRIGHVFAPPAIPRTRPDSAPSAFAAAIRGPRMPARRVRHERPPDPARVGPGQRTGRVLIRWGVVRCGDRYALVQRRGDGSYMAHPRLRRYGGTMLHGALADVLPHACSYETPEAAAAAAARWGLRVNLREDRWSHPRREVVARLAKAVAPMVPDLDEPTMQTLYARADRGDEESDAAVGEILRLRAALEATRRERDDARRERDVFSSDTLRAERDAALARAEAAERDLTRERAAHAALREAAEVMADHVLGKVPIPEGYEPDIYGDPLGFKRALALRAALRGEEKKT